ARSVGIHRACCPGKALPESTWDGRVLVPRVEPLEMVGQAQAVAIDGTGPAVVEITKCNTTIINWYCVSAVAKSVFCLNACTYGRELAGARAARSRSVAGLARSRISGGAQARSVLHL